MEKKNKWRHLFQADEWHYFLRLGNAMGDADDKRVFFETVITKKQGNRNYSVYDDFPRGDSMQICKDILKALKAVNEKHQGKDKTWTPRRAKKQEMLSRLFAELILQGFHNPPKESA